VAKIQVEVDRARAAVRQAAGGAYVGRRSLVASLLTSPEEGIRNMTDAQLQARHTPKALLWMALLAMTCVTTASVNSLMCCCMCVQGVCE
jgi:hypothetical protein